MSLRTRLARWLMDGLPAPEAAPAQPLGKHGMKIRDEVAGEAGANARAAARTWVPYKPPPGVLPHGKMAMDAAPGGGQLYAWALQSQFAEGLEFMGYPYLAELTQRAEYRRPAEIIAKQMTRKWIKFISTGDDDKTEVLTAIEAEFKRLKVQAIFERACELEGYFGRAQIYLDLTDEKDPIDPAELKTPLHDSPVKVNPMMKLKRLSVIEPMWTYPNQYNSSEPLKNNYYKPDTWFVMGTEVHSTRLLTFVARPVPDILKAVYAFGGLSLSQMAKPYVDNWLRTRQSVSDLVHSFSTPVLKTNMSTIVNGGGAESLWKRLHVFTRARDNRGVMAIDKETEDFTNVTTPLGSLDKLQAQAQEHMATVFGIPLIVLFGITPSGLNASSEGELDVFEAWCHAQQEQLFTPHLTRILRLVQLSIFGSIDDEIGFEYEPLGVLDELQEANTHKAEVDADVALIDAGVITPMEARIRLAGEDDSPYAGLDLSIVPEAPDAGGGEGGFPPEPGAEGPGGGEPAEPGQPGRPPKPPGPPGPPGAPGAQPPKEPEGQAVPGHPGAKPVDEPPKPSAGAAQGNQEHTSFDKPADKAKGGAGAQFGKRA
jgi:phage-related protein (TIGR01555 family)